MESSRDSSVWRNLAVTFGGGLALGAVGMKLTQTALRPLEVTPTRPDPNPLTDRLSSMERRLERIEQTPVSARTPGAGPAAGAPIDQKVLEAVIGAVDARLHEHAGQMDRRLADLEARIAVEMQSLRHLDRQAAEGNEKRIAELQGQFRQEAAALRSALDRDLQQFRQSLSQALAGQTATQAELQSLNQQHERIVDAAEQRFADIRYEYRQEVAQLRESVSQTLAAQAASHERKIGELRTELESAAASQVETRAAMLEQSLEARIVTAAAAATAAQFEERLTPLRAEVQQKEQELLELRQRLAESERAVLDVVLAIGQVCRQAADRIGAPSPEPHPAAPPPQPAAPASVPAAIVPEPRPEAEKIAPAPLPVPAAELPPVPELAADPSLAQAIPDFLHEANRKNSWRIPLVSSFLVTTGCLLLLHYL